MWNQKILKWKKKNISVRNVANISNHILNLETTPYKLIKKKRNIHVTYVTSVLLVESTLPNTWKTFIKASKIYLGGNIYPDATQISLDWSINAPFTVLQIMNPQPFSKDFTCTVFSISIPSSNKWNPLKKSRDSWFGPQWRVFMLQSSEICVVSG